MPERLLAVWPLEQPLTVRRSESGTNNLSYDVTSEAGEYLLRIYQNTADPRRIRWEHALLKELQRTVLPFAVPAPVPSRAGETLVPVSESGDPAFAALFHRIPGRHPEVDDLAQVRACGAALAELDAALARIELQAPPGLIGVFGDLHHAHPDVPDPFQMVEGLPIAEESRASLAAIFRELLDAAPSLYDALPQQIIYSDFGGSNVLLEGDRVTGILDFEFAYPDLRAMDLAVALTLFEARGGEGDAARRRVAVLGPAYLERLPLTPQEIEALPTLMRLFCAVSLIHREGRRRRGQATEEDVLARVRRLLRLNGWLGEYGQNLLEQ